MTRETPGMRHGLVSSTGRIFALCCTLLVVGGCMLLRIPATNLLGAARTRPVLLDYGSLEVPSEPRGSYDGGRLPVSGVVGQIIDDWAYRELPSWKEESKVTAPRVILAKLSRGVDIELVNAYLLSAEPTAGIGSTYGLRPSGDYDFSLPPLTAILYLYGDEEDFLYPATREHLLSVLLNQEGNRFRTTVPGSLGLITETENHILMTEGSRYLKNRWLALHGSSDPRYDNVANGMHDHLLRFLVEMDRAGPYEFNSTPYSGYTAMALLTLEAFAEEEIALAARRLLDRMNWEFALGSMDLRRYPVYRRQPSRADRTGLLDHPQAALMAVWVWLAIGKEYAIPSNTHQAVYAALMPYRLPLAIAECAASRTREHYVQIGRGPAASPELYSAGDGYLLSAGGTGRPARTLIVARPTVLLLEDEASDLEELFRIGGEGDYRSWNNTGVIPGFAVARSPALRPERYRPLVEGTTWAVYAAPTEKLFVAVADTGTTAAIYCTDRLEPEALLSELERDAAADSLDSGLARLPDGRTIEFDLDAPADEWVITRIDGAAAERDMTLWPRLTAGRLP
jgi:hypothetical protein